MQRMLLSCKSMDDARFLKNYIEAELPYEVLMAFSESEIETSLRSKSIHLLMMQTGNVAQQDLNYAMQLRKGGFAHPIMMISNGVGETNISELSEKQKIYFLERPFELKVLKGLARKLLLTKGVSQQTFRRFRTDVVATLETFVAGDKFTSNMFNLSKGGAYFELTRKPNVSVGDLLRLKVTLADMDREHHIHGRVMWTTHKGHVAGGYGLGLKFMKSSELYRNLVKE